MKKILIAVQVFLAALFFFSFFFILLHIIGGSSVITPFDKKIPVKERSEEYDPSLSRLNTIELLEKYCDSIYLSSSWANTQDEVRKDYTDVVTAVVRKKFYHGYSYYRFATNYVGFLTSRMIMEGLNSVVIPNDIVKYPNAACSQQAIVVMEVLRSKGFEIRKVGFQGKEAGHFCFEVFFDNQWHFYDTNMEPDVAYLKSIGRPGIAYLAAHPDILLTAYRQYPKETILDVFPNYFYGEMNEEPAPRAVLFQKITRLLSYLSWIIFGAIFLIIRRRYLRLTDTNLCVE